MIKRRKTRAVWIGDVQVGGGAPVSVQSMTTTHTHDIAATVRQIKRIEKAGCDIIRVAVPDMRAADALAEIKGRINIPLVADVHFRYDLCMRAIEQCVDALRMNPGNMPDIRKARDVARAAKAKGIPIRIGVNSGSVRAKGEESADLVKLMVKRALQYCGWFESVGFKDIVISLKASDCMETMEAYRAVAGRCDYPLHLGVTAAGPPDGALVKSAVAIGGLLSEGIGDTIRVSFTGPPEEEVRAGIEILKALGLRRRGIEIVSCPTCGRCEIDLVRIVKKVKAELEGLDGDLRVAVMGCVVNGPGEAREADVGIAGGKGFGYLFKRGRKVRKVAEKQMVSALVREARRMLRRGGSRKK